MSPPYKGKLSDAKEKMQGILNTELLRLLAELDKVAEMFENYIALIESMKLLKLDSPQGHTQNLAKC